MRRCKHYYLERFVSLLQALHQIRSQVDPSAYSLFSREVDFQDDVRILRFNIVDAVDQCFVHVKDQHFLMLYAQRFRKVYQFVLDCFLRDHCEEVPDEVKG